MSFSEGKHMSTGNVARRMIELCRAGQFKRALDELYAQDARSIGLDRRGLSRLCAATGPVKMRSNGVPPQDGCVEVHSVLVSDPLIAGPFFAIALGIDATDTNGDRRALKEVCVYEVRNDKIVREQFFQS
jgi:hypothetical protein